MTGPFVKNLRSPDEIFRAEGIVECSVQVGEQVIGRATVQPGWRWSEVMRPIIGTPSCAVRHIGLLRLPHGNAVANVAAIEGCER